MLALNPTKYNRAESHGATIKPFFSVKKKEKKEETELKSIVCSQGILYSTLKIPA